jgi:hypothetical protein
MVMQMKNDTRGALSPQSKKDDKNKPATPGQNGGTQQQNGGQTGQQQNGGQK